MQVSIFSGQHIRMSTYDASNSNMITLKFAASGVEEEVTIFNLSDAHFFSMRSLFADAQTRDYAALREDREAEQTVFDSLANDGIIVDGNITLDGDGSTDPIFEQDEFGISQPTADDREDITFEYVDQRIQEQADVNLATLDNILERIVGEDIPAPVRSNARADDIEASDLDEL